MAAVITRSEAEDFLYEEARLLDECEYEAWLDLFTEDAWYWIPMIEGSDPSRETSILWDDAQLRRLRVHQLTHKRNFAQSPPSRTVHQISNVQVRPSNGERDRDANIRCNLVVHEIRTGDHRQLGLGDLRALPGKCEYILRREVRWRIAHKKVVLINRHTPIVNLSFLI